MMSEAMTAGGRCLRISRNSRTISSLDSQERSRSRQTGLCMTAARSAMKRSPSIGRSSGISSIQPKTTGTSSGVSQSSGCSSVVQTAHRDSSLATRACGRIRPQPSVVGLWFSRSQIISRIALEVRSSLRSGSSLAACEASFRNSSAGSAADMRLTTFQATLNGASFMVSSPHSSARIRSARRRFPSSSRRCGKRTIATKFDYPEIFKFLTPEIN